MSSVKHFHVTIQMTLDDSAEKVYDFFTPSTEVHELPDLPSVRIGQPGLLLHAGQGRGEVTESARACSYFSS